MVTDTMEEEFGQLRAFMNQTTLTEEDREDLWRLLDGARETDRRVYEEQWIPYLRDFATHWKAPLKDLRNLDELRLACKIAPFAHFALIYDEYHFDALSWEEEMELGEEEFQELMSSPCLRQVRDLNLTTVPLELQDMECMARSEHMRAESLSFGHQGLTGAKLEVLLRAPWVQNLRVLSIWENYLGNEGVEVLANTPHLCNLKALNLGLNRITDEGVLALAASPHLESLETLGIYANTVRDDAVLALVTSEKLPRLTSLELEVFVTNEGVRRLANTSEVARLDRLGIWDVGVNKETRDAIDASAYLAQISELEIV